MADKSCNDEAVRLRGQIERLLEQQHDALMRDNVSEMERKGAEIMGIIAALSLSQKKLLGLDMEKVRTMHSRMIAVLQAKKELARAELAVTRQRRNLNRLYRSHDE